MQSAKCINSNVGGSLAEKRIAQLISIRGSDSLLFFPFFYAYLFNVLLPFFLQTEAWLAAQKNRLSRNL